MTYQERSAILDRLVELAEAKSGEHRYSHAFGVLSAIVSDEGLVELDTFLKKEGF